MWIQGLPTIACSATHTRTYTNTALSSVDRGLAFAHVALEIPSNASQCEQFDPRDRNRCWCQIVMSTIVMWWMHLLDSVTLCTPCSVCGWYDWARDSRELEFSRSDRAQNEIVILIFLRFHMICRRFVVGRCAYTDRGAQTERRRAKRQRDFAENLISHFLLRLVWSIFAYVIPYILSPSPSLVYGHR